MPFVRRIALAAFVAAMLGGTASAVDWTEPGADGILREARSLIADEDYAAAIEVLAEAIDVDPRNAGAHNLMGFSLRKSGDTGRALDFYLEALRLSPNHRGANEYLGELYFETGEIEKAQAQLDALERICGGKTCPEYQELAAVLGV